MTESWCRNTVPNGAPHPSCFQHTAYAYAARNLLNNYEYVYYAVAWLCLAVYIDMEVVNNIIIIKQHNNAMVSIVLIMLIFLFQTYSELIPFIDICARMMEGVYLMQLNVASADSSASMDTQVASSETMAELQQQTEV